MVSNLSTTQNSLSRVWVIPFQAGPANVPAFEGHAMADTPSDPRGDITNVHVPDPNNYGRFLVAGRIRGDRGAPTLQIGWRYLLDRKSVHDRFVKNGCEHDIHVHMGECKDPMSFNEGWEKVLVLAGAIATDWTTNGPLGALSPTDLATIDEQVPFSGSDLYHIYRMIYGEEATTEIVQEIVDIEICDAVSCGACGIPSNGCDKIFAITLTAGGSPGLPAELIFSQDAALTWGQTNISTLAANEDPDAMACVAINVVVISDDSESLHYAPIADILNGTEVWTEVTTGFVATFGPLAIHSESSRHTWIVGTGGYIYFTQDPTASVVVQDAGVATTQNLNAVHAFDIENVVAVGDSNAVVITRNGGTTWTAILGPNVGVALNTVWMRGPDEWFVGDAGGQLWYTLDAGVNWIEKTFPGSGSGVIREIKFSKPGVGFMAHDTAAIAGRILRSIDGGQSWYVTPEGNTTIPANDRINAIAVCEEDVSLVYGGGLADDASDGIVVKGAGPSS